MVTKGIERFFLTTMLCSMVECMRSELQTIPHFCCTSLCVSPRPFICLPKYGVLNLRHLHHHHQSLLILIINARQIMDPINQLLNEERMIESAPSAKCIRAYKIVSPKLNEVRDQMQNVKIVSMHSKRA